MWEFSILFPFSESIKYFFLGDIPKKGILYAIKTLKIIRSRD